MSDDVRISAQVGTRSVDRAVRVLMLLAEQSDLGLGEIARRLTFPKSSTADLLKALVARNFVSQDHEGHYRLGLGAFEIGAAYVRSMTPVNSVAPELESLTRQLSATSHFAVLDGDEVIYLAKHDPPLRGLELASALGARLPAATTAVGKAQLAFKSARESDERFDSSNFVEFARIRTLGYALDDGGAAPGVCCVAAPIFSPSGCCGAIGVSALVHGNPTREEIVDAVVNAAARATERLGGARPHADAVELGRVLSSSNNPSLTKEVLR